MEAQNKITKEDALAANVMKAMGGQKKWDNLHFVSWTFMGNRKLVWDKKSGRVRIDDPKENRTYLININNNVGRIMQNGVELTQPDSIVKYVEMGKSIWINDAYWLFMPFKLKDPGVSIKYVGIDTLPGGNKAEVIALTFDNVGKTPNNKYHIFIDSKDNLVKQWAYFRDANQKEAPWTWPWDNYKNFDGLLLSSDRSDKRGPSDVKTYKKLADSVFSSFDKP